MLMQDSPLLRYRSEGHSEWASNVACAHQQASRSPSAIPGAAAGEARLADVGFSKQKLNTFLSDIQLTGEQQLACLGATLAGGLPLPPLLKFGRPCSCR